MNTTAPATFPWPKRVALKVQFETRIGRAVSRVVHELGSLNRTRRNLFRLELALRGIPHNGDPEFTAVEVFLDGLWYPVAPWFRDQGRWVWMIDHPYRDLDDPVLTEDIVIGYHYGGLRMDLSVLPKIWRDYAEEVDVSV